MGEDMEGMNGIHSVIDAKGFFERILKEFKETLAERERGLEKLLDERNVRLDERFQAQREAINKAEQRLDGTLKGFPQEYARRLELEQMINALDETSTVLAQKVVDSASALAEAQTKADERLAETQDKTDERTDIRFKKLEDYQARLTGMAIAAPIITAVIVFLLTRSISG